MFSGGGGEGRGGEGRGGEGRGGEGRGRGRGEGESMLDKQHSSHTLEYGSVCIRGTQRYTHTVRTYIRHMYYVCTYVHVRIAGTAKDSLLALLTLGS